MYPEDVHPNLLDRSISRPHSEPRDIGLEITEEEQHTEVVIIEEDEEEQPTLENDQKINDKMDTDDTNVVGDSDQFAAVAVVIEGSVESVAEPAVQITEDLGDEKSDKCDQESSQISSNCDNKSSNLEEEKSGKIFLFIYF